VNKQKLPCLGKDNNGVFVLMLPEQGFKQAVTQLVSQR